MHEQQGSRCGRLAGAVPRLGSCGSNASRGLHNCSSGQGATVLLQGLRVKFAHDVDVMFVYLPHGVAVSQHDRGASEAGRAPPAGVRILSSVCRYEKGRVGAIHGKSILQFANFIRIEARQIRHVLT